FDSFVYVDYYSTDGQVQHLFPNITEPLNLLSPRQVYTVGQPDDKHMKWTPLPPFGRELITVIATKQPLVFTPKAPRYDPESARSYHDIHHHPTPPDLPKAEMPPTSSPMEPRKPAAETP